MWCVWKNSEKKYYPKYDRDGSCLNEDVFTNKGEHFYFWHEGFDIYAKVERWEELLKENPSMAWDEAYEIYMRDQTNALLHNHIDTESMDADGDVGCPLDKMSCTITFPDPTEDDRGKST